MTQHPYAEILRAIADGAELQRHNTGTGWEDEPTATVLYDIVNNAGAIATQPHLYRIKPRTIRIGEFDVPEPMREAPARMVAVYFPDPTDVNGWDAESWDEDDPKLVRMFQSGLLHLTREAALVHAQALLSLSAPR